MKIEYPFKIEREGEKYLVHFVDLKEAFTEGDTLEQAIFNAQDVLSLVLAQRMEDGEDIPTPSKKRAGQKTVAPEASVQAALLTRMVRENNDKTMADLARALDTSWPAAQRLEDPRHATSLKQLERAAAALGHTVVISFEKAA
jgi:antitoxin HicB